MKKILVISLLVFSMSSCHSLFTIFYHPEKTCNPNKRFKGKKIDAQVTTGGGAGVTKQVKYLIDGEVLFSINSRYTGGTYRNFINTGPLLREILEKA